MRVTTVFRRLLGVTQLVVVAVVLAERSIILSVRPRWRRPRCGRCGRVAPGYDRRPTRRWRHLHLGRMPILLEYAPRRVNCAACKGVHVERVPWAEHGSNFTRELEELVAYLAQVTDITQVTKLTGIAWRTVCNIVERVVARRLDPGRLDGLRRIGIDEFGYRRRHRYLTVVVDHESRKVVWATKGRTAEALESFFDELGQERCMLLEHATIDMAAPYIKALEERVPHVQVVFDRFHVQRLASDAVDEVRRTLLRDLRGTPEGKELFGSRFALLKSPWNLTDSEKERLSKIQRTNAPLYRAYLLKESLAKALDYLQPWKAERELRAWLSWASRSRLEPFVRVARTIRQHFDGILAYIGDRLTNGLVEGINNKLRTIARRAYGYHSAEALMAMLFLCCGNIKLDPPLPTPTQA